MSGFVEFYAVGLGYLSACAPKSMSREDIEAAANVEHPTGIASRWRVSSDPTFRTGQPNPCPCESVRGRVHHLLSC